MGRLNLFLLEPGASATSRCGNQAMELRNRRRLRHCRPAISPRNALPRRGPVWALPAYEGWTSRPYFERQFAWRPSPERGLTPTSVIGYRLTLAADGASAVGEGQPSSAGRRDPWAPGPLLLASCRRLPGQISNRATPQGWPRATAAQQQRRACLCRGLTRFAYDGPRFFGVRPSRR